MKGSPVLPRLKWTEAGRAVLRESYPDLGAAEVAARVGRTPRAVILEAGKLGLRYRGPRRQPNRLVTDEQLDAIRRLYGAGMVGPEIAAETGLKLATVRWHLRKLGLRPGKSAALRRARAQARLMKQAERVMSLYCRGASDDEVRRITRLAPERLAEVKEAVRARAAVRAKPVKRRTREEPDVRSELARIRALAEVGGRAAA